MIPIYRGEEPPELSTIREAELARLRVLIAQRRPTKKDFGERYNEVKQVLWKRQYNKCCYCESREQLRRNDTEHFRPKARAWRGPGFHDKGYWWLAWTWGNLFFACRNCNQDAKNDQFLLEPGSPILTAERPPPGAERALLIDPALENPMEHIQFRRLQRSTGPQRWVPTARNGSIKGAQTIRILKLARPDLLELYNKHVEQYVQGEVTRLMEAEARGVEAMRSAWEFVKLRLLTPSMPYVGLSYDALHELVPEEFRTRWGLVIPKPT